MPKVNPQHTLKILQDDAGHKLAEKLFLRYCRDADAKATLPAFLLSIDQLLQDHDAEPAEPEEDEDDSDQGEDYEDDQDVHELPGDAEAETAAIRSVVSRILAGGDAEV